MSVRPHALRDRHNGRAGTEFVGSARVLASDVHGSGLSVVKPVPSICETCWNAYSIGADLTVALAGPAFWVLSVEFTARHDANYRHLN